MVARDGPGLLVIELLEMLESLRCVGDVLEAEERVGTGKWKCPKQTDNRGN